MMSSNDSFGSPATFDASTFVVDRGGSTAPPIDCSTPCCMWPASVTTSNRPPARTVCRSSFTYESSTHRAALAGVLVELLEQLQVGEAQPNALDLREDLIRPRLEHVFRRVQLELTRTNELNRVLLFRKGGRRHWVSSLWHRRLAHAL